MQVDLLAANGHQGSCCTPGAISSEQHQQIIFSEVRESQGRCRLKKSGHPVEVDFTKS